jgi:tetratricopeptide (TPR) repeat protein
MPAKRIQFIERIFRNITQSALLTRIRYPAAALCGLCLCTPACLGQVTSVVNKPPASTASPASFEQIADRARAAMDGGQTQEAVRLYERATALQPRWSEGWWSLGTLLFDDGKFSDAAAAFQHFVAVETQEPGPGYGMLGMSEFHLHQDRKALDALEHARAAGLGTNVAFVQAVLYHDGILNTYFGHPEFALQSLTLVADRIAEDHPEGAKDAVFADHNLVAAFGLAALRLRQMPADVAADKQALIEKAGHAQALIAIQDRAEAGAELKELVAQYPGQRGVHYMYGVYLLKEDPPSAVAEFRREIEVSPSSDAARIQLAFEFLRTADYTQGLKFAREAVTLAPGNFVAHVACGRLWLATGDTKNALAELRTAVKLAPGSPDTHFALSRALAEAGQAKEAAHERAEFERLKALSDAAARKN